MSNNYLGFFKINYNFENLSIAVDVKSCFGHQKKVATRNLSLQLSKSIKVAGMFTILHISPGWKKR
jgi:hypothetical protein